MAVATECSPEAYKQLRQSYGRIMDATLHRVKAMDDQEAIASDVLDEIAQRWRAALSKELARMSGQGQEQLQAALPEISHRLPSVADAARPRWRPEATADQGYELMDAVCFADELAPPPPRQRRELPSALRLGAASFEGSHVEAPASFGDIFMPMTQADEPSAPSRPPNRPRVRPRAKQGAAPARRGSRPRESQKRAGTSTASKPPSHKRGRPGPSQSEAAAVTEALVPVTPQQEEEDLELLGYFEGAELVPMSPDAFEDASQDPLPLNEDPSSLPSMAPSPMPPPLPAESPAGICVETATGADDEPASTAGSSLHSDLDLSEFEESADELNMAKAIAECTALSRRADKWCLTLGRGWLCIDGVDYLFASGTGTAHLDAEAEHAQADSQPLALVPERPARRA